jgi:long-chain fatty acid transport protein
MGSFRCGFLGVVPATAAIVLFGFATQALAQTNDDVFPQLQWSFGSPGARANAMGRAFIAVADDATAAVVNPSGLVNLTRPQVSFEYQGVRLVSQRLTSPQSLFDAMPSLSAVTVASPSFASVALPAGKRIALAFSRSEFLNYKASSTSTAEAIPPTAAFVLFPTETNADFRGTSYGGSVAVAVRQNVSVGATFSENVLRARAGATRYDFTVGRAFPSKLDDVLTSSVIVNESSIDTTALAFAWSAGILVRPFRAFAIGAEYSKGPSFQMQETVSNNPGERPDFLPGPCCGTNLPLVRAAGSPFTLALNVPDRIGVGISYRPTARLLLAADGVRVDYSELTKSFAVVFDAATVTGSSFAARNVTEFHAGAELNIARGRMPLFLRAGVFTDPSHGVRFLGSSDPTTNASESALFNLLPELNRVNGTLGFGVVAGLHFELDAAYVFTMAPTSVRGPLNAIVSGVLRF